MSKTILLADDSVTIQKVVELTFMGQDYQVTAVSDGGAALAMLSDNQPDIVIADVHMPGPNGYELARHAKQQYPGLPVLLLVGTFEPFDEQEMIDCGAESHLKKPFDSQDLMREVERLVEATAAASSDQEDTQPLQPPLEEVEGSTEAEGFATSSPPLETGSAFDGFPPAPPLDDDEDLPALTLEEVEIQPEMVSFETGDAASSPAAVGSETSEIETESFFTEEVTVPPTQEAPPAPAWGETPPAEPPSFSVPPVAAAAEEESTEDAPTEAAQETPVAAGPATDTSEEVAASAAPGADNGSASLSDADVDRIARRVVELMGESSVREVAWEIIPDLAEVIIRERIRELENQVE